MTGPPRVSALLGWGLGPGSWRLGMGTTGVARALPRSPLLGNPIPSVSELSEWDPGGLGQDPRWGPLWVPPGGLPLLSANSHLRT